jgi:hypothetical protein
VVAGRAERDERQGLVRREIRRIAVFSPGKGAQRFNPDTVEIEFRDGPGDVRHLSA